MIAFYLMLQIRVILVWLFTGFPKWISSVAALLMFIELSLKKCSLAILTLLHWSSEMVKACTRLINHGLINHRLRRITQNLLALLDLYLLLQI